MKQVIIEQKRDTEIIASPDLLVVGSGPAGVCAAIAASRLGAKTLLIEKYGFVGGNLTTAMVNPIFTFHDIHGRQIISGVANEIVSRLFSNGFSPGYVTDLTFDNASMTPFDSEGCKTVLFKMLEETGVDLLLHTLVVDAITTNGKVSAVIIESKSGRQAICPKYVIDCSADGDVAVHAGANYILGDGIEGIMQPATLYFRIGGVDRIELKNWMKLNRSLLKENPTDEEIDSQKAIALMGLNQLISKAISAGELDKEIAPRILMYELPHNQFSVNTTRLQNIDGTNTRDITKAEIVLRKQVIQTFHFIRKYIGGFNDSYIIDSGIQVGIRETRHIICDYTLTKDDILNGTSFNDGIACGTFAIDIHPPKGRLQIFTGSGKKVYEIPYRCLLPIGIDNLLVAGRCISATHEAYGSIRVMATCMAMGQGAGVAAALIIHKGITTREINVEELKSELIKQGQYILNEHLDEIIDKNLILKKRNNNGQNTGFYNPFLNQ